MNVGSATQQLVTNVILGYFLANRSLDYQKICDLICRMYGFGSFLYLVISGGIAGSDSMSHGP